MPVGRHVLDEQRPGHFPPLDQGLVHSENVRSPLGLIGAERTRRVEDAGRKQPARPRLEPVGRRQVKDAVVSRIPVLEGAPDILFGRPRGQPEEGVGEVVSHIVVLGREVVGLGLAFLPDQGGLFVALMHVVGNRAHVVEELAVDRPALVLVPDRLADEFCPEFRDGILQQDPLGPVKYVAQPLVGNPSFIGRLGSRRKPAFVDPASVQAVSVEIARIELEALSGLEKRPWNPVGQQRQKPPVCFQGRLDDSFDILRYRFQLFYRRRTHSGTPFHSGKTQTLQISLAFFRLSSGSPVGMNS